MRVEKTLFKLMLSRHISYFLPSSNLDPTTDPYVHKAGEGPTHSDLTGEGSDDESAAKAAPMETEEPPKQEVSTEEGERKKQVH